MDGVNKIADTWKNIASSFIRHCKKFLYKRYIDQRRIQEVHWKCPSSGMQRNQRKKI